MSDANKKINTTNFIRNVINNDLESKLHSSVQTRFPPEPNGYLHIGHAKSICLNFGTANLYKGKCNLRFDDTNPTKEDIEYVNSIKADIKWLGFDWNGEVRYSSNYFHKFYELAVELIKKDLAYVCFLDVTETRKYRGTLKEPGVDSPYRNSKITDNLALFEKMKNGDFKEGECVLRAKIDMSSSFICMRDPALYRIKFAQHHNTGDDWCIYPMYDFAHCISDAIENVTHSLCTLEFQDNRRLYDWILENLDEFNKKNRPRQYEFSRLNLAYTLMSKRKLQYLVENKIVNGWDDPRMPTITALRRRGYTPEAIRNFADKVGISKIDSITDVKILEDCLRDDLNVRAPRTMAVLDPIKVIIENYEKESIEEIQAPIHPQNESMGKRTIYFGRELYIDRNDFLEKATNNKYKRLAIDKEVRLRNSYVIKATRCEKDKNNNITKVFCNYDKNTLGKNPDDGRKVKGVIHFVEASKAIKAEFILYDRLFITDNPAKAKNIEEVINPNSYIKKHGFIEPSLAKAEPEFVYQFEREGYFCRDNIYKSLVFNKTVGLRDSWNQ